MVLFLLMWRRRRSTKTKRPAIRTASSPPTTPAAIMERPEGLPEIYIKIGKYINIKKANIHEDTREKKK